MNNQTMIHQFFRNILVGNHGIFNMIPDKLYLQIVYAIKIGGKIDWENPKGFNEKLQWLKVYNRDPRIVSLVDKVLVRDFVASTIGEKYLVPLLGKWDDFDDIDFDALPDEFVLKCNHDSGSSKVCRNKATFDIKEARKFYRIRLRQNFYWPWREWPYRNVRPQIMAEHLLKADDGEDIKDYKFMCFNGRCECAFVCSGRRDPSGLRVTFFDREWNRLHFERHYLSSEKDIPAPRHLNELLALSERLAVGFPFVRVDFYEIGDKIFFGELTFFPGAGFEEFSPREVDVQLGSLIDLKGIR